VSSGANVATGGIFLRGNIAYASSSMIGTL